jgi:hypothetical protein
MRLLAPALRSWQLSRLAAGHSASKSTRYVDVAVRRWQRYTGRDATLESTGQTFEEVLTARAPARGNKQIE